jgi:ribosomal protein S19E (S16A)
MMVLDSTNSSLPAWAGQALRSFAYEGLIRDEPNNRKTAKQQNSKTAEPQNNYLIYWRVASGVRRDFI